MWYIVSFVAGGIFALFVFAMGQESIREELEK